MGRAPERYGWGREVGIPGEVDDVVVVVGESVGGAGGGVEPVDVGLAWRDEDCRDEKRGGSAKGQLLERR